MFTLKIREVKKVPVFIQKSLEQEVCENPYLNLVWELD